jgi:hypothetical protein
MRAGHQPRIVVSSCLAGLFIRLTGLFVRLTGLFVRLTGLFVSLADFWVFGNKICQTVGDDIFFPSHIILGVSKQRDLGNKICQTVGDALSDTHREREALESIKRGRGGPGAAPRALSDILA